MTLLLADALKQLALSPGQSRRVDVGDYQVEIRRIDEKEDAGPMLTLWLDVPFSSRATTLLANRGNVQLPAPFEISESDLAPE